MAKLTQRTILLVDDLSSGDFLEGINHLSRYATGIAATHNVIIATPRHAVAELKNGIAKRKNEYQARIQVIGFSPHALFQPIKMVSKRLYRLIWNFALTLYLKQHEIDFDVAHVLNRGRYPVSHFLWRLKRPVIWGELESTECVRRDLILPFYGFGAYLKYSIKRFWKTISYYLDPFLAKALYKSDRVLVAAGSCIDPIMVDPSRQVKQKGFPLEMPKRLSLKPAAPDFNFLCAGNSSYSSGFDVIIESFAAMLENLPEDLRPKVRLSVVNTGRREMRLTKLIKTLNVGAYIEWIDDPNKEELKEIFQRSFAYVTSSSKSKDLSLVQAMAHGIPMVVLDTAAAKDYVGEAAIKVSVGSRKQIIKDMAFAFKRLIMEPELSKAYALLALSRYRNYFTYTSYVQYNLLLFEDLYMRYNYYQRFKGQKQKEAQVVEPIMMG